MLHVDNEQQPPDDSQHAEQPTDSSDQVNNSDVGQASQPPEQITPDNPIDSHSNPVEPVQSPSSPVPVVSQEPQAALPAQSKTSHKMGKAKIAIIAVVTLIILCLIGGYIHNHKAKKLASNTSTNTTKQTSTASSSNASNQALQSELSKASSYNAKSSQDASNLNSSLNDQSTMTSVP
jgi:uncharacterized protein HemX